MRFGNAFGAAVAATMASTATAAVSSHCPNNVANGPCYTWGVPESVSSAGSGNFYFQLRAPTRFEWVALGIGSQMRGADIFVMYADGSGNVTISPREGKGHVMPQHVDRPDLELLAGSGIVNGEMIANVRCGSCKSANLKASGPWIASWKEGDPLNSKDPAATITIHDDHDQFDINLAMATVNSDSNPFVGATAKPPPVSTGSNSKAKENKRLKLGHGIIMMLVFTVLLPLGSVLMVLAGKWWLHSVWQMLAYLLMWAGFAMGYTYAHREDIFWKNRHTQLGVFVVSFVGIQPILGWIHHTAYKKTQSRGIFSYIHVWFGRIVMILGIVNGGLGLQLASQKGSLKTAYIVLAAVFGALYIGVAAFGAFRGLKKNTSQQSKPFEENGNGFHQNGHQPEVSQP